MRNAYSMLIGLNVSRGYLGFFQGILWTSPAPLSFLLRVCLQPGDWLPTPFRLPWCPVTTNFHSIVLHYVPKSSVIILSVIIPSERLTCLSTAFNVFFFSIDLVDESNPRSESPTHFIQNVSYSLSQ